MNTNGITNRFPRSLRIACHAATLVFCAWWLVATSAPITPARDCFKGLGSQGKIKVTIGSAMNIGSQLPSCGGIDGLVPGAAVTLTVSQGPRPQNAGERCYRYDTTAIDGLDGVTTSTSPNTGVGGPDAFTIVEGASFSSTSLAGCDGVWDMVLGPTLLVNGQPLMSPFDAGSAHPWILERQMGVTKAEACGGKVAGSGEVSCEDQFTVQSITDVTP